MLIDPLSKKLLSGAGCNSVVTLMYHSITLGKSKPSWNWALSLQNFCNQLSVLQDFGWTTVCAQNLSIGINNLPPRTVLITFDDGYADNMAALEQLVKRKMHASWFVVTKDLGQMSSWKDTYAPTLKLLEPSQLLEMQDAGMEIGSHTHTHCRLTQATQQEVNNELCYSKYYLSELLNKPTISFAYPYGLYNQQIISATKSAGYKVAFTASSGFGLVNNSLLEVRRVSIMAGDSLSTFARKLAFADNDVSWPKLSSYIIDRAKDRLRLL